MTMVGADPAQLDELARLFKDKSAALMQIYTDTRTLSYTSSWEGEDCHAFRDVWDNSARVKVAAASTALTSAAEILIRQAEEQRKASDGAGGKAPVVPVPPGKGTGDDPEDGDDSDLPQDIVDAWNEIFKLLGLPEGVWDVLKTILRKYDPESLKDLGKFLAKNPAILEGLKMFGKVVDIGTVIGDFANDWLGHGDLPMDERLVHASVFAGSGFLISQGIEKFSQWAGGAIGSLIGPGGTIIGAGAGFIIGQGLSAGFEYLDGQYDIKENAADLMLEGYQNAKDIGGQIVDAVTDTVGDVVDGAQEIGGAVVDGAGDVVGTVGGWIGL